MQDKHWLVEIRLKDWRPDLKVDRKDKRTVCYEEVLALDEVAARFAAFDQFERRSKYEPVLRRKLVEWGVTDILDCCAPVAVEIS